MPPKGRKAEHKGMNRDQALAALGRLEQLARLSPEAPDAIAEFRRIVAGLKALPGAKTEFRENLTNVEASAAQLFLPQERSNSDMAYTGRTRGVSLTILLLADIAAARRNLPDGL